MDKELVAALARAAGLEKALVEFPADVRAAVEQAQTMMKGVPVQRDATAEPWPPMRPVLAP